MSKAPGSPSFRPPKSNRLLPKLSNLSLSPSPSEVAPQQPPPTNEEPPSVPALAPVTVSEAPTVVVVDSESSHTPQPGPSNDSQYEPSKKDSLPADDDIHALDDEGWSRVANAKGIEEMLKLGEGVSGAVSKCRLRKSGQIFAIKTITTESSSPEHLLRELKFNQSCNSPYIVKFYGAFVMNGSTTAIAMEFCEGRSLEAVYKKILDRGGKISEKVLGKIACAVLGGLSYLHEKRIIHRDVKPGNILLTRKGEVKLCDFGISKEVIDSLCGTGEQTFVGTSMYMAPERISGHSYSIRSDLWSLGITLMEVAQGRFPFPPPGHPPLSPIDLVQYLLETNIASLLEDDPESNVKWSQSFRHFLGMCLEKEFDKRPSPEQIQNHPWVKGLQRLKSVDMERWIKEAWGWQS